MRDPKLTCAYSGVLEGVRFQSNSAQLTIEAQEILKDLAYSLATCSTGHFILSAHTDSRGSAEYNQALSKRRAISVVRFLKGAGIDHHKISARAYGEMAPIDTNDTDEGRHNNRRVEFSPAEGSELFNKY